MFYIDARNGSRTKPIVAVAAIHTVIAYAFISGLAMQVVERFDPPIVATNIPDDPPPPANDPTPRKVEARRQADVITVPTQIERPDFGKTAIEVPLDRPSTVMGGRTGTDVVVPPKPTEPATHLARASRPLGNRGLGSRPTIIRRPRSARARRASSASRST